MAEERPALPEIIEERDQLTIRYGNTEVIQTKDRVTVQARCTIHPDFESTGG